MITPPRRAAAAVLESPALVAMLAATLSVSLACALAVWAPSPKMFAGAVVAALLLALVAQGVRRWGALGVAVAAIALSILAGELSAIAMGGQSGRLLWADAVLASTVAIALMRSRLRIEFDLPPFLIALGGFLVWSCMSVLPAADPLTAIAEIKEWMAAWVAGLLAATYASDVRRARFVLGAVAAAGAVMSAHMAWVAFHAPLGPVLTIVMKQVDLPWGRTNYLAGILILQLPLALGLAGTAASGRIRAAWIGVAIACATGIVLSASKGAIVALVAALIVAYGLGGRATRAAFAGVALLCATGALVFTIGPLRHVLEYRLQRSALDYSIGERVDLYRLAWDEFVRHPLLGIGLNNFSVSAHRLTGVDTVPHNLELGFLAELGLPGLVLAIGGMVALLGLGWRARGASARGGHALGVALWATFLAAVIHNQFESTIYGEQYKLVLVLTIAAAVRLTAGCNAPRAGGEHPRS